MSDSEDDWFQKDIDEFTVQTQPSNVEHISVSNIAEAKRTASINNTSTVYNDAGLTVYLIISKKHETNLN